SRAGLTMPRGAWRTRCGPSLKTSASSTSASSRTCRKRMARRCWSCVPEKNCSPCWARTRPDGLDPAGTARGRVRGLDGQAVPLVRGGAAERVLPADEGAAEDQAGTGRADQGDDRRRALVRVPDGGWSDRKSTRLNSSHVKISYAVFCLK